MRTQIYEWNEGGGRTYSTEQIPSHGKEDSLCLDVPPMGAVLLYKPVKKEVKEAAAAKRVAVKKAEPIKKASAKKAAN